MSINSALSAGVSGLVANSSALSAISDNIANANTVGYKQNDTQFEDLVTSSSISNNYNAGGVSAITSQLVSEQGGSQNTNSSTDLSITGSGMFVVTNTPTPSITDTRSFTRAGSFTVDAQGDLQNAAGFYLQGFPVAADGSVTVDPSDLNSLQTINVGDVGGTATPTTQVAVNANLDSTGTVSIAAGGPNPTGATVTPYNAQTNNMASYDATTGAGVQPDATINVPISDSEGGQQTLQIDLLKSSTANQWYAEIVAPKGAIQYGAGSTLNNNQVATGTLVFNTDGTINTANSTLFGAGNPSPSLDFGASGATPATANGFAWGPALGIGGQDIAFNLSQAPGGITQFDSKTVTQSINTNGTQFGNLDNVSIDDQGFVTASYDNGVSKKIAQVALATFENPDGLKSVTGDAYQVSGTSGGFNLKTAGSGGAGTITPNELETSTVDLSTQFSSLITTQEAYSASAKIITTADQMLQALINIKQ